MRIRKKMIVAVLFLATAVAAPKVALGYGDGTPDDMPPAEELPCDAVDLPRAAYGLCIAYCEANDCHLQPDKQSCASLRENYERHTGESLLPCDLFGQS
jgi:hypothetical protein